MIKLNVPLELQDPKSSDCGIKCIGMISKYYNRPELLKSLEDIERNEEGDIYLDVIGSFLEKNGFSTQMIFFAPYYFTLDDRNMSQENLKLFFKKSISKSPTENSWMKSFLTYMELGGNILIDIPKRKTIEQALLKKSLIITHSTTRFFYKNNTPFINFHFVLTTGIDSNNVFINDPGEGSYSMNYEEYLYSFYSVMLNGFSAGSLLLVSPKD